MLEVIQMFSLLLTVVSYARHILAGIFYAGVATRGTPFAP